MAFHDLSFRQRFATMGDEAERVYEAVKPMGNTIRFGWDRPKGISFKALPTSMRHLPDYYAQAGYFVEVMGLGKDDLLKSIKVNKYEALKLWAKIGRLLGVEMAVFIWNSHRQEYVTLMWRDIVDLVNQSKRKFGIQKFKNDGNEYYQIPWEWLTSKAVWTGVWVEETQD